MKRTLALLPFALLFGCGPATPAESPAPAATAAAEPAPSATPEAKPADTAAPMASAAPTAAPSATPDAKPAEPPAPTSTLGGKEFKPKVAITAGPLDKGRVLIGIMDYDVECRKAHEIKDGEQMLIMSIEWKQGEVDFSKNKTFAGPHYNVLQRTGKPKEEQFPATGKVELSSAPTEVGKSTRLKLDLTSGKDTVKGDVELFVCQELKKGTPKKGPDDKK